MTEHSRTEHGRTEHAARAADTGGVMRIPRTRGALSGFLLIILGLWGALVPFIGPYFNYSYTPDSTWSWTAGRLWLEVLPGAATVLGGLLLLTTANRANAALGGWLASAAGAWFVVGPVISRLWAGDGGAAGTPVGDTSKQVFEQIGFFTGLGAVILFLAAHAAGRVTVRSLRDVRAAERHADTASAAAEPVRTREPVTSREPVTNGEPESVADQPRGDGTGGGATVMPERSDDRSPATQAPEGRRRGMLFRSRRR